MNLYQEILTPEQLEALNNIASSKYIEKYYLTGGTALTAFYYPYRYSIDLDFFSEEEIDTSEVVSFFKMLRSKLQFKKLDIQTSFNRNIVFLEYSPKYTLKLEFTYYPFPRIQPSAVYNNLHVDSKEDIAVNKLFTIYQNPRYRDYTDLFVLINENNFSVTELMKKAKIKFDWHIDSFTLGKQFKQVTKVIDVPIFIEKFNQKNCEEFFLNLSKEFGKKVIST